MDCEKFGKLLESFLEERLEEQQRQALLAHASSCASCREMIDPPADLAGAILDRTSGPTCGSARRLLCGRLDEELERTDAELVGMHLEACADCAALSAALSRLQDDLPLLGELDPGVDFVGKVLARTTDARPARRLERFLKELWRRPRIAWEGAYVGALIFGLVFVAPASPLAGAPLRALELAKVNPVAPLAEPAEKIHERLSTEARSIWSGASGRALALWRGAMAIAERGAKDLGTLRERLASEQEKGQEGKEQGEEP